MHAENIAEKSFAHRKVSDTTATRIRVWDLPVRIFHWSLVVAVMTAIVTGLIGGDLIAIHGKAGIAILGLVIFRLVWGFIGSTYARFLSFTPSPRKVKAYLTGEWRGVGHNPLGAFSVFALLGLLLLQAGTGLFANDDIAFTGQLNAIVSDSLSTRLTAIHHWSSNILIGFLVLHILAILFYESFKKDNLVKPMVTGWKVVRSGTSTRGGGIIAVSVATIIALAVVYGINVIEPATAPVPAETSAPAW